MRTAKSTFLEVRRHVFSSVLAQAQARFTISKMPILRNVRSTAGSRSLRVPSDSEGLPLVADRDILRGICLASVLSGAAWVLDTDREVNFDEYYQQTCPMQRLDAFLSHAWSDHRFSKWAALCLHFNLTIACFLGLGSAGISFILQYYSIGCLPAYSFTDITGTENTNGICCLITGCLALCLGMFFGHRLQRPVHVFLDRACISQTDKDKMQLGVDALGDFLAMSERMIVLLSPDYFKRGWCTFEVSSFGADDSKGFRKIDFEPLHKASAILSVFAASVLAAISFHVCIYFGIMSSAMNLAPEPSITGFSAFGLFVFCAPPGLVYGASILQLDRILSGNAEMLSVLKMFDIEQASFMFEDDRAFVLSEARRLWGDLDTFNRKVTEEVYSRISSWASKRRATLPYSTLVLGASPCLFWGLDMAAKDPTLDLKLRDVVYGMTLTFLHVPLLFAVMGFMCEIRFAISRRLFGDSNNAASKLVLLLLALILGPLASMLTTGIMLAASWQLIGWLVAGLVAANSLVWFSSSIPGDPPLAASYFSI